MEPHLIQRGKFKKNAQPTGFDAIIQLDYMGSSEFEFGALPASLKVITSNLKFFAMHDSEIKSVDGRGLWFLASHDQFELVKEFLQKLSSTTNEYKFFLKEASYLQDALNQTKWGDRLSSAAETEFWWDVENHWMACLGSAENALTLLKAMGALRDRWKKQGKI